jgi:SET domain-containing protein
MSNVTIELYDDEDGRHVLFFANEDVKKGDLLTIDYGPKYWEALGIDSIEEYDIQKS